MAGIEPVEPCVLSGESTAVATRRFAGRIVKDAGADDTAYACAACIEERRHGDATGPFPESMREGVETWIAGAMSSGPR